MHYEWPNVLYGIFTKYHGSLSNPLRTNVDFPEQTFARNCDNSGETEEVNYIIKQGLVVGTSMF